MRKNQTVAYKDSLLFHMKDTKRDRCVFQQKVYCEFDSNQSKQSINLKEICDISLFLVTSSSDASDQSRVTGDCDVD